SDGNGGTDTASVTVTVSPVNDPPLATADYTSGTVQYSDGIPPVSITGSDIDSIALTISSTWTKDGGPGQGGLPEGLSLSEAVCDGSMPLTCTWTLGGEALVPAGIYGITFNTVDDGPSGGLTDSVTINLTVGEEDAAAVFDPDNPVAIEVEVPGGESGPFSLVLYVNETLPDVAAYGPYPGEIDRANCQMELVPVGPGSSIPGACSAGSVSGSGYDAILPVTCSFDGVPVNTYTVEGTVYGVYYSGGAEDVFTIYDSSLGFTTGGGWFYWPGTDEKTNFGFTMKYNRKATNLKGNLLLIRHLPNGTIYRLKSNALQGLSLGESADEDGSFGWASFSGKATYLEPGWTEPEGNHEFVTYVEDRSEPGSAIDRFWIEVKDKDGNNVLNLSIGRPAEENAEMLHGGTIVVPHSGGGN
ncbi:MAG: hypothetical protein GTO40_12605, partial [Deltaproteobacteria bacterium]|nr:hypothetical protein [Deltaproteobacteria bacterium]NIS75109.1 hypothetical protein [Deltaproteobacteria bacterium]